MTPTVDPADVARSLAVLAALALTGWLAWLLPSPGFTTTRLAFFGLVAAVAWVGAAGAVVRHPALAAAGAVGLLLLGFWQAVLWLGMIPAALALGAAAVATSIREAERNGATGE